MVARVAVVGMDGWEGSGGGSVESESVDAKEVCIAVLVLAKHVGDPMSHRWPLEHQGGLEDGLWSRGERGMVEEPSGGVEVGTQASDEAT